MAFPLLWMLLTAVSPDRDLNSADLRFWPSVLRLDNFSRAWNSLPFSTWLVNSVAIALVAVVITVAINLVAGFVLAKMRFTGRSVLLLVIVSTLMIPVQVLMIPQFRIVAELGWVNTYWAVIIPRAAEAFGIFLSRQFMLAIPDELIDAARVDGAGTLRILRSVILPLCKPLIAVLVIFTFMYRWNEFAWPLIVLKDQGLYTLPIGLTFLQGQYTTDYSGLMAMALVSALPMLVVFLVFQRYLVEGISTTGLK
ncbi:carbohydrate ABC transporter permease [Motilibacter sp. K478]|nr:carbohydrate ABC transporter permease [Motilibacter aurantiacus]